MKRVIATALFTVAMIFGGQPVMATTFAVGTCRPKLPSFTTISAAVAAVPPGSIVEVCPGIYPEQVTISTPLTLIGGTNGNADRVTIVVPPSGMIANAGSAFVFGGSVGAQVAVTTGPVNIKGITMDGTGVSVGNATFLRLVGVFYGSGSFGTVDGVTVRNEVFNAQGVGIWAENENGSVLSVTISDSSIYNVGEGIFVGSDSPNQDELQAKVEFNDIDAAIASIDSDSIGNLLANNVVAFGIADEHESASIVGNTVIGGQVGISSNGAISSNVLWLVAFTAIAFNGPPLTIKGNRILGAGTGIDFQCSSSTVTGNFINDVGTGIANVPSSFTLFNNFKNADTIRTGGCP